MEPSVVHKTYLTGLQPIILDGQAVYAWHSQLKKVLGERLGEEYAELLTDPVITRESLDGTQESLWLSTYLRGSKTYASLSENEKNRVNQQLTTLLSDIEAFARELRTSEDTNLRCLGELLPNALSIPGIDCVYANDENVSLACWGFTSDKARKTGFDLSEMIQKDVLKGNASPHTKIRIKVVDKESRPATNLRVTASYKEASAESDTDPYGRVNFPKVPIPSDVKIRITLPDQVPFEEHIRCEKEDEEHLLTLPFTFEPKAVMRFQILNSANKGLKKIPLRLEGKGIRAEDITDEEGRSEFSDIPVGAKVALYVNPSGKEPLAKNFQCSQQEELYQIVIDAPKKKLGLLWLFLGVLIFVVSIGLLAWRLAGNDSMVPQQPVLPTSEKALGKGDGGCRCQDEIEELRQELRRLKAEIAETTPVVPGP